MKIPLWATFFTVIAVFILIGLGIWQLHRLEWKEALLLDLEKEYALNAQEVSLVNADFPEKKLLLRGYLEGHFVNNKSILIEPRTMNGWVGGHLLTAFYVPEGDYYILVNRGWVPDDKNAKIEKPEGHQHLIGAMRHPLHDNVFVPQNRPNQNQWYRIDIEQISTYMQINIVKDRVFYVEDDGDQEHYPVATTSQIHLNNNHLNYALFWFSMAGALVVVYFFRFLKTKG